MSKIILGLLIASSCFGQAMFRAQNKTTAATPPWAVPNSCGNTADNHDGSPNIGCTFSTALTNPSIILVGVRNVETDTVTCTDTAGNTYADSGAGRLLRLSGTRLVQVFIAYNTHTTSSNSITCTASIQTTYPVILANEITGGATSSAVDQTNPNDASSGSGSNNLTTGAKTTLANGEFIYGFFDNNTEAATVGTSPNLFISIGTVDKNLVEYFAQTTAGSIAAIATNTWTSQDYGAILVTLKH